MSTNSRTETTETIVSRAKAAIEIQQDTLDLIKLELGGGFAAAVHILTGAHSIITSGLGKSGFIARKMAASLTSLQFHSQYLHPVDALHGDGGFIDSDDVLVAFSKSGETPELLRFTSLAKAAGVRVVAVTARRGSSLGNISDAVALAPYTKEIDDQDLLPTTSTTSAMIVADLLTVCCAEASGGMMDRLSKSHPDGAIGAALLRTVEEVMHSGADMPTVRAADVLSKALIELTTKAMGIVCVVDDQDMLLGIITDGDIRRIVSLGADVVNEIVNNVMTLNPITISPESTLHEALTLMEKRSRQISVLPVVRGGKCVGVIRIHDAVRINL
jgi:arabinose-5-phosphate isomerase